MTNLIIDMNPKTGLNIISAYYDDDDDDDDIDAMRWSFKTPELIDLLTSDYHKIHIYYHDILNMMTMIHTPKIEITITLMDDDDGATIKNYFLTPYNVNILPYCNSDIVNYNKLLSIIEDIVGKRIEELTNDNFTYLEENDETIRFID